MAQLCAAAASALALAFPGVCPAQQVSPASGGDEPRPILAADKAAGQAAARDWVDQIKNPVPWFTWGGDVRIRHESLWNPYLTDSDPPGHNWSEERLRVRGWATLSPCDAADINARLTWEGYHWWMPDSKTEWQERDVPIDNLNAKLKFKEINSTLTIGRQDIIFGDGWLVLDGTPLDGSRTIFFDAARWNTQFKEAKTAMDVVFIQQESDPDRWAPPLWSKSMAQIEQDERGVILYFTNKSIARTSIEPYFIYKHDSIVDDDPTLFTASGKLKSDTGDIYAPGVRVTHEFDKNWSARAEGAYEFGVRHNEAMFPPDNDKLSAFGFNSRLNYAFLDQMRNQLHFDFEVLSGDDRDSRVNSQFDPLWGRWPQFSELMAYQYAIDTRIGEQTNLWRFGPGWQVEPTQKMQINLDYNPLFAYANTHTGEPGFSSDGKFRGHLFTACLRYRFNRFLSGHILGEYFITGNYTEDTDSIPALDTRRDNDAFLRGELVFTF